MLAFGDHFYPTVTYLLGEALAGWAIVAACLVLSRSWP